MLVAAGGSATTDGGAGAIEAVKAAGGLGKAKLEVLCDVSIPFERAAGCSRPKGADPQAVARLTERLTARAGALPRDPRGRPMTGAAGGLGRAVGGVRGSFPAPPTCSGCSADRRARGRDRGGDRRRAPRLAQSFEGKLVGEVARRCRAGVPLHAIAGKVDLDEAAVRGSASRRLPGGTLEAIEAAARELAEWLAASPVAAHLWPAQGAVEMPAARAMQ